MEKYANYFDRRSQETVRIAYDIESDGWTNCREIPGWLVKHVVIDGRKTAVIWNGLPRDRGAKRYGVTYREGSPIPFLRNMADEQCDS